MAATVCDIKEDVFPRWMGPSLVGVYYSYRNTEGLVMLKKILIVIFLGVLGSSAFADYVQIGTPGASWSQKPWCGN